MLAVDGVSRAGLDVDASCTVLSPEIERVRVPQSSGPAIGRESAGDAKKWWSKSKIFGAGMNAEYDIRAILSEQDYLSLRVVCDADDWCNPGRRAGWYDDRAHHGTVL